MARRAAVMSQSRNSSPAGEGGTPGIPRIVGALAVLAVAVGFLLMLGLMGARWYLVRNIPPSELEAVRRFIREPVHFPPEWAEVEPFPEDVLQGKESLRLLWDAHSPTLVAALQHDGHVHLALQAARNGTAVADEEWTSVAATIAYGRPVLEETSRVVSLAGYDLEAGPPGLPDMETERCLARLACAAAYDHARNGEWAEAIELAMLPLHMARCHPLATVYTQLHGMYIRKEALRTLEAISGQCPDPLILERTLVQLRRMEGDIRRELVRRADFLGGFAALRSFKRAGYPVDLSSGKPGSWYYSQLLDVQPDFPAWMLGRLPSSHPWRPLYTKQIIELNLNGIRMKRESRDLRAMLYRAQFPDTYFMERHPYRRGMASHQQPVTDAFDSATRVLEQRIAELHRARSTH